MPKIGLDPRAAANVIRSHADLGWKYHEALRKFDPANAQAGKAVDKLVRGMDRPLADAFDALAARIGEEKETAHALCQKLNDAALNVYRASQLKAAEPFGRLVAVIDEAAAKTVHAAELEATASRWTIVAAIGVGTVAMALLGIFLAGGIAKALAALIGEVDKLTKAAVEGKLYTRGSPELVSLEFRPIVEGVNATLDTLVGVIDNIPAPVLLMDRQFKIQYINDVGAKVIGLGKQEIVGTKCYQQFKTPHCNTANCAARRPCNRTPWRRPRRWQRPAAANWKSPTPACRCGIKTAKLSGPWNL